MYLHDQVSLHILWHISMQENVHNRACCSLHNNWRNQPCSVPPMACGKVCAARKMGTTALFFFRQTVYAKCSTCRYRNAYGLWKLHRQQTTSGIFLHSPSLMFQAM